MTKRNIILQLILACIGLCTICSCNKTNTPKEFQNSTIVPTEIYQADKLTLEKMIQEMVTSDSSLLPNNKRSLTYLESYVDTLFYGPNDQIAFLGINKRINKNADIFPVKFPGMIEYYSSAFIGYKKGDNKFEIIKDLKFHFSQDNSYKKASKHIRQLYFNEIQLLENENWYNINDVRFWDCDMWNNYGGAEVIIH